MSDFKLRNYQKEAVKNNLSDLEQYQRLINVLPTAAGKTEIMSEIASQYIQKTSNRVLILAHLSTLVKQTKERVQLRTHLDVGVLQAEHIPKSTDKVIVGTRQTVSNTNNLRSFKDDIGLIIVDEVHGFLTKQYDEIIRYLPHAKIIGFTATPYKDAKLITNFFDIISYSKSMEEMIEEGYIVRPELKLVSIEDEAELGDRVAKVVHIHKYKESCKSAVIFMQRIEECKTVRNILKMNSITSVVVTSKTSEKKRDEYLESFKKGDAEILITCNVVSEGFDVPILEVIYMPYPTYSPTLFMQRMGRAMRLYPNKESCRIYAFGTAPMIKKGFYHALKMGQKKKITVLEEREIMELSGDTKTETYLWTVEICEIANKLKDMGKDNLCNQLLNKQFPPRYLKNPDLIRKALEQKFDDNINSLEQASMSQCAEECEYNIIEGLMRGRHVQDLPWEYKKRAWAKDGYRWRYNDDTYKKIRKYYRLKKILDKKILV